MWWIYGFSPQIFVFKRTAGQYLQLSPAEEIVFKREDGETTGHLLMTNVSNAIIAYKVNT